MINFDHIIDLPLIWGGLICIATYLYVVLDGFDLGVGILFPFAPSNACRNKMMNSVAPFWDGNETWLILGGGGLFAAFPLAYSIIMPALYMPILIMLVALIFRGVAFEFRFKASLESRKLWDFCFHFGSLFAALSQGIILGAIVQGISVEGRLFSGQPFDWLSAFSLMTGVAVVMGYGLLGATWLIMKTDEQTQKWARQSALYVLIYILFFMFLVSIWVPFLDNKIHMRWFSWPNFLILSPIPIATVLIAIRLVKSIYSPRDYLPFLLAVGLFTMGFVGLAISLWPWIVPYHVMLWEGAAAPTSLSILLIGAAIILPIILIYTGYSYYVFRGKTTDEALY